MAFQLLPPNAPMVSSAGKVTPEWYRFFLRIQAILGSTGSADPFDDSALLLGQVQTVPTLAEVLDGATIGGGTFGAVTLDFGAFPGSNEASASFADMDVVSTSNVHAWFDAGDSTADHTAADHRYAPLFINLTATAVDGVGGTIYARSEHKMQGQWDVRYVWN